MVREMAARGSRSVDPELGDSAWPLPGGVGARKVISTGGPLLKSSAGEAGRGADPKQPLQGSTLRCLPGGNWAPAQARMGPKEKRLPCWQQGQGTHRVPRVYCPCQQPAKVGSISPAWLNRKLREGQG